MELLNTNDIVFMVIDVESKTNDELKCEVYERVKRAIHRSKVKTLCLLDINNIKAMIIYVIICKFLDNEFKKMIKQFYMQIDYIKRKERGG